MNLGLNDAKCLISGSSRGIGRAIAEAMLREGAYVGITGRNKEFLDDAERDLARDYGSARVRTYVANMAEEGTVKRVVEEFSTEFGALDIAIANVGPAASQSVDPYDWEELLRTNLMSAVFLLDAAMPYLEMRKGSAVIISSIAAIEALGAPASYSSAKIGLLALGKQLAREKAHAGIRVNVVLPGNVLTAGGSWDKKMSKDPDAVMDYISREVPMKRFGKPEEIAAAVVFLASPVSSFTTGTCFIVDGGQTHRIC